MPRNTPHGARAVSDEAIANSLADAAREAILPHFRAAALTAENKAEATSGAKAFDPVTIADRAAEEAMRGILSELAPDDGVFGEEFGRSEGASGRLWVLDPIDGTRAFMAGLPSWGVLIGLHVDGATELGLMDQPYTGERFIGRRGAKAATFYRGFETRALRSRPCETLETATLLTTDPDLFRDGDERDAYEQVAMRAKLRRYGCDCYAYAMIAGGWADLVIETGLQPYDIQALIPIIEAAGGVVTDWSGAPNPWEGRVVAAGDARTHAAALELLAGAG